ncbi:hypothetical protein [Ulvibacter antarcticus]|uniref:Uncharacterized protein n=1 Tax=Ulvibacter antarcticus TaxID=442714 RepID=A0A3L9YH55_9FLAO|nr:hypothetical protein [Ulvibacter antarcticus]RMA58800.1 hypothetical protein BXY75_2179 [Ulvibacter antarcticus]
MKPTIIILFVFFLLNSCKNGESNKNSTQAIQDSITNTETRNVEKTQPEVEVIVKNNKSKASNPQDDWYWKNTLMSKNNKFEAWDEGEVELVMTYRKQQNDVQSRTFKVGSITSEGLVTINLPKNIKTETKLDNLNNLVFYDLQDISNLEYKNHKTGYFSNTTIGVEKNGITIGNLTIGNSVRTTYNLTNQSTLTMGDEGYLVYLAYVDGDAAMLGDEIRTDKVRRDGTNTIEAKTTVVYDLGFKSGWNFVKTEIIGSYDLKHERGLNASWFKKHNHTLVEEMPSDAEYFFRKESK